MTSPLVACLSVVVTMIGTVQAAGEPQQPKIDRIGGVRYELHGPVRQYVDLVTRNWLLTMPERNPAVLEMFRDRDKKPYRDLLVFSGEFAGKYLTGAVQVERLTGDPALKAHLAAFVAQLVKLQDEDGYLGPYPREQRWNERWDVWGHYHAMLGLLLWHEDTGDKDALRCAVRIGDLLCKTFLNAGRRISDTGKVEMNHAAIHSLCLLYRATRKQAYLDLAQQIVEEFQQTLRR